MKTPTTWILVADGSHAKILQASGKGEFQQRSQFGVASLPSRDLVSDRPGRSFDRAGQGRHAMEPPSDPHVRAKSDFLGEIVDHLDISFCKNDFARLVVVAPPKALGDLRAAFPKRLSNSVIREIPKDVVGFDAAAMRSFLRREDVI